MKKLFVILFILIGIAVLLELSSKNFSLQSLFNPINSSPDNSVKLLREENLVIDVVKNVGPSVVTIGVIDENRQTLDPFEIYFGDEKKPENDDSTPEEQYIGTGFVVKKDGLIVTNKHVVSELGADYVVVDDDGKSYPVKNVYRDPANDVAILQTNTTPSGGFKEIELGDSSNLQVGQFVIAIGTALGEFPSSVTTGIVSGLGRGITAGSPFQGFVEELDNVIQTDAAINPGNSGGPLLNSSGQVIGINTAVSGSAENIGFAIPINIVRESIDNFNKTGQFTRPYLGVSYAVISQRSALLNDVPQGVLIQSVIAGSAADEAGVEVGDILTEIDNQKITGDQESLAVLIAKKKIGDTVELKIYRDGQTLTLDATLKEAPNE